MLPGAWQSFYRKESMCEGHRLRSVVMGIVYKDEWHIKQSMDRNPQSHLHKSNLLYV